MISHATAVEGARGPDRTGRAKGIRSERPGGKGEAGAAGGPPGDLYVVVLADEELVLARVQGHLNRLLARVMEDHSDLTRWVHRDP